jgi:hypothetical protein
LLVVETVEMMVDLLVVSLVLSMVHWLVVTKAAVMVVKWVCKLAED